MSRLIDVFDLVRNPFLSGEKINEKSRCGTPLHRELLRGNLPGVLSLVRRGAKIEFLDVQAAAREGNAEIVTNLLDASGMSVSTMNRWGDTLLHIAAEKGDDKLVQTLLDRRADINARNEDGWTPLHRAVQRSRINTVKTLVQHGADVHARDNTGMTPREWVEHNRDTYENRCSVLIGLEEPHRPLQKDNKYEKMIAILSKQDEIPRRSHRLKAFA